MPHSQDLQRLFRATQGMALLLRADAGFTIVAASEEYLRNSRTDESILGRPVFEVFPDNPALDGIQGSETLRASLAKVLATRQADRMPVVRYDVRLGGNDGEGFEERYWASMNLPVLDEQGEVEYIAHRVEEATTTSNRRAIEILE